MNNQPIQNCVPPVTLGISGVLQRRKINETPLNHVKTARSARGNECQVAHAFERDFPTLSQRGVYRRNDNLFTEHWTPEIAAAGYDFDGFEIKGASIVLRGVENACGFIYRINIALPLEIIDNADAIEGYFQHQLAESKTDSELSAATINAADPPAL